MRNVQSSITRLHESAAVVLLVSVYALTAPAAPVQDRLQFTSQPTEIDAPLARGAAPGKALQDTVWIADWRFDAPGGGCTSAGWIAYDNRVHSHGENYWVVDNRFDGQGGVIVGKAALLSKHDLCWVRDGYGNDWDFSLILEYSGPGATLAFDGAWDTEPGFDFVTVEADSLGLSEARVDACAHPNMQASDNRITLVTQDGMADAAHWGPILLPDFGPGVHKAYIRFTSDAGFSDEDGEYLTALHGALVVDNLVVTGALAYREDFDSALGPHVMLANTAATATCGAAPWARLFSHVTDNDKCVENVTCAWLASDPTLPAYQSDMAFGPGGAVVRNWIDDVVVGPWVSLAGTPSAVGTVLWFRRFLGTSPLSRIKFGWSVRSRSWRDNTDTPAPGDSVPCVSPWTNPSEFGLPNAFSWATIVSDLSFLLLPGAPDVQVRFRVVDLQHYGDGPPLTLNPGPGPYWDRVRIGRRVLSGPAISIGIDSRTQAQDAFPTVRNALAPGEHFSPDGANRFGTCAFSAGQDLGSWGCCSALITGDSIVLESVVDARHAGGIATVRLYGAITSGPHAGKAPAPYSVAANGFFQVNADSARNASGTVVANRWFVDADDTYFRGGDVLKYFWLCVDNAGGATSSPAGLSAVPSSVATAENATAGLSEVSSLPGIDWAPSYLARVGADASGDLDPTPAEIAASHQSRCFLYYQRSNSARRSGDAQRTSFMYTLDRIGYAGQYDVYDIQGSGSTNNHLGGRANVAQAGGYSVIIQDDGRSAAWPNMPDGTGPSLKIDQARWYRDYLAQGVSGVAGRAAVWLLGENTAAETPANPLFATDLGLSNVVNNQSVATNPEVLGTASFTWAAGGIVDFTGDLFALQGGCPTQRAFDGATPSGTAVATHRYRAPGGATGPAAVIMNKNTALKWNTVWTGFGWFDIRDPAQWPSSGPGPQEMVLAIKILGNLVPRDCGPYGPPTDTADPPATPAPQRTELYASTPNPFNPVTTIRFDLAQPAHVVLRVYDVSGRVVRALLDESRAPGAYRVNWNGCDAHGRRVASGVYFYRLDAGEFSATRKTVLLE